MEDVTALSGQPCNLKSVGVAVAGLLESQKRIASDNKGKPKLAVAEVKAWIGEGRP